MLTVACVLRSGGEYTPEYVERLKAGVDANLTGHEFVCLSDMDAPNRIPLETNWPHWWAKLEVFRLKGKVLYFDLDTVIHGSIQAFADYPHRFSMLRDFYKPDVLQSGVMAWDGDYSHLYRLPDTRRYTQWPRLGDGAYIREHVEAEALQDLFPGMFRSYKAGGEGVVTCYHGRPKPHETGWAI